MKYFGFILLVVVLFVGGFAWRDIQNGRLPSAKPFGRLVGLRTTPDDQSAEQVFKRTYTSILNSYYKPVKPLELKYAGIGGMVSSLGDPHTLFLEPVVARNFDLETKANYSGVGARLSPDAMGAKIATVFKKGPADTAGVKVGDMITAVDGLSIVGKDLESIVGKIMGPEGSNVKLTIVRAGEAKPIILTVRRAHVTTPTVESKFLKEYGVGYITVSTFAEPTANQFDEAIADVESHPIKGLVIDLRGNPGGLLETAVEMLSRFKGDKTVVKMRFRDGHESVETTPSGMEHGFNYPIVILMNEDSASAAEIFAGALHDYRMVTLVGTHSYGKASVQNVFPFIDGSSAKITIARYFLPSGENIGRKVDADGVYLTGGLEPDVKVEFADVLPANLRPGGKATEPVVGDTASDNQLQKAIQVVLSKAR